MKGRSLECRRLCSLRCTNWVKRALQESHPYGLKPEWSRMCVFRLDVELNFLPHSWHAWGFSPEMGKKRRENYNWNWNWTRNGNFQFR